MPCLCAPSTACFTRSPYFATCGARDDVALVKRRARPRGEHVEVGGAAVLQERARFVPVLTACEESARVAPHATMLVERHGGGRGRPPRRIGFAHDLLARQKRAEHALQQVVLRGGAAAEPQIADEHAGGRRHHGGFSTLRAAFLRPVGRHFARSCQFHDRRRVFHPSRERGVLRGWRKLALHGQDAGKLRIKRVALGDGSRLLEPHDLVHALWQTAGDEESAAVLHERAQLLERGGHDGGIEAEHHRVRRGAEVFGQLRLLHRVCRQREGVGHLAEVFRKRLRRPVGRFLDGAARYHQHIHLLRRQRARETSCDQRANEACSHCWGPLLDSQPRQNTGCSRSRPSK